MDVPKAEGDPSPIARRPEIINTKKGLTPAAEATMTGEENVSTTLIERQIKSLLRMANLISFGGSGLNKV